MDFSGVRGAPAAAAGAIPAAAKGERGVAGPADDFVGVGRGSGNCDGAVLAVADASGLLPEGVTLPVGGVLPDEGRLTAGLATKGGSRAASEA